MFVRMLISYILFSIIPVVISGIIIYKFTSDAAIKDAYNNYEKALEQMVSNTDQYMVGIYNIIRILSEDSTVRSYRDYDVDRSYSTEFLDFLKTLSLYKDTYQTIDSIYLYYHDRVITSENGMKWIDDFDDGQWCKKVVNKARESNNYLLPYVTEPRKRFNNNNENKYDYYDIISVISPMGGKNYESGMVIVNIREKSFRDNLDKLKQNNYDQIFILDKKSGNIVSRSNESSDFNDMSGTELLNYVNETSMAKNVVYINNKKAIVTALHSSVTNWEYIAVSDYNRIMGRVVFIRNSIAACVLLLIIIGFTAAVVIVGRIYAPIQDIVANVLNLKLKPETDEVSSIRDYIHQILIASDNDKQLLSKSIPSMIENTFLNLLRGRFVDERDVAEKLRLSGIELKYENYMTVILAIDMYSIFVEKYSLKERLNFKYYVLEVVGERLNEIAFAYGMETDQDKICFIMNIKERIQVEAVKELLASVKKNIRMNTDITFTMGIGKIYSGMESVRHSFTEAMEALKERFTLGEDNIIYIGDVENKKDSFYTHIKVEEELLNSIYAGNEGKISQIMQTILEDAAIKGLKREKVRQILLEVISFVGRQLFKEGVTYEDIFNGENTLLGDLEKCETLAHMEAYITNVLISVSKYVRSEENSDVNTVITRVKEYLNKNYSEDLSLTKVAEIVKLSPSYLSTVFYKETKYNFLEYLNSVRINRAKELLLDGNFSIKEVSSKVGYLNYNTFSKVFKKYTGVSAKQYRYEKGIKVDEEE